MTIELFDSSHWEDILSHMKKHRVRTGLTAFGVFWGIFLLLILLGAGNGIEKGVLLEFGGVAVNSIHVWGNRTSLPYNGYKAGRYISLTDEDTEAIKLSVKGIEDVCPRQELWGANSVKFGKKDGSFTIKGDVPSIINLEPLKIVNGRFINRRDMDELRKVTVIGSRVKDVLFGDSLDPIGNYVEVNGIPFLVVGVFEYDTYGGDDRGRSESLVIPYTTLQRTYNRINEVGWFSILVDREYKGVNVESEVTKLLGKRHNVHPEDRRGIGSWNTSREFESLQGLFSGIRIFLWIVGLGTLLAGMIGVSNVMLIIVKERTREIGLRKTLGATPISIVSMIIQEAFLITGVAGYSGVISAIVTMELISLFLKRSQMNTQYFSDPEISLPVALAAMGVLIISGLLAGFFPAVKASRIHPVEALREE